MNKTELIDRVHGRAREEMGATRNAVEDILNHTPGVIQEELASGHEVQLTGFGKFEAKASPACTRRNPRTGETVQVEAKKRVRFVPGKLLKEAVNS